MKELRSHPGFYIRDLTSSEFEDIFQTHHRVIFKNQPRLSLRDVLTPEEKSKIKTLQSHVANALEWRLGVFCGEKFAGWHVGDQKSNVEYYMRNSAILPEFRRLGLYSALLKHVVDAATEIGFQTISSRHTAVNNPVIIPKLKLGFVMTGFELSDVFGTLVNLSYLTNEVRRRVLAFRSGEEVMEGSVLRDLGIIS